MSGKAGRFRNRRRAGVFAAAFAACWVGGANASRAGLFETYVNVEVFALPGGASVFTVTPDGRIVAMVGAEVYVEEAPGNRDFSLVGALPSADIPSFGAAFISVSPDGTRIAVGNNGGTTGGSQVGVFGFPSLDGGWVAANHFLARWADNDRLILAAGDFPNASVVTVLDATDAVPANWTNTTVVENIGGASGGVALDGAGTLFTANGFSTLGPSGTGAVKAFAAADWLAALSGGLSIDFEASGVPIVDILSGSPLAFDSEGNLLVGGAASVPDNDAVAIIRAGAVAGAAAGGGTIDVNDPLLVRRVDPIPENDFNFFTHEVNLVLGELYVRDQFGGGAVYVYRDTARVPALGEWGAVCMSLGLLTAGTVIVRRRTGSLALAV